MRYRLGIVILFFAAASIFFVMAARDPQRFLAQLFFPESISVGEMRGKYQTQTLKVLVVPGHDDESFGTQFREMREADLTLQLSTGLVALFKADPRFEVFLTRDSRGYVPEFASYFARDYDSIISFRDRLRSAMSGFFGKGFVEKRTYVNPNFASEMDSVKLYGINKWANEHGIDLVIHVHFNDYPGRRSDRIGEHSGMSMYIPEGQLPNARASREIGQQVFAQLRHILSASDLPLERAGIIEDQEFIAIGANASLDAAVFLVEYGYIYESQLRSGAMRDYLFPEMAYQTYAGVKKFFEPDYRINPHDSTLLPHAWNDDLSFGMTNDVDVAALQRALTAEGVYRGPLTGNFFERTRESAIAFQRRYNVGAISDSGHVGPYTRKALNERYAH